MEAAEIIERGLQPTSDVSPVPMPAPAAAATDSDSMAEPTMVEAVTADVPSAQEPANVQHLSISGATTTPLPEDEANETHVSTTLSDTSGEDPQDETQFPDDVVVDDTMTEAAVARLEEHDSLVTVRLSEPPALSVNTATDASAPGMGSTEVGAAVTTANRNQRATMPTVNEDDADSDSSNEPEEHVDWNQLQQNEDEESHGQSADNTAMLLARLEQENAKLATNPKSVRVHTPDQTERTSRRVRAPSIAQLRDMVRGPTPPVLRYSMLPPPPMTDLEFYAALVQDYQQTAARLPTLLSNKIRKGIPPPLRGVVWQGMTSATCDVALGEQYDRFCDATSPYEGIIGKDLGRSFPGVEMFRDPDGDGQRMLGRVLKSYSLHEPRIGYCQGLAFLVGPLLMHMPDKEAFCVLVKLMENYDLRSSYMPDLAGLHVRIYQFRELLRATLPELSSHLDDLQVDPAAYVSQWFLSFFAVTCPLPMLFRMYDVVFAEGAAETIMRVALSLMQKNQARLLACAELEDAMQLLLSRGLWDCYRYNADDFVQHFLGLSTVVTRDRLASLDQAYRETQAANNNQSDNGHSDRSSAISAIASRFLGRLWTSSSPSSSPSTTTAAASGARFSSNSCPPSNPLASPTSASPSANQHPLGLSPGLTAPAPRPMSLLQRSSSKHSLASTINSMEASSSSSATSSSSSVLSSTSTEATSLSRESSELNTASKAAASQGSVTKNLDNDRYLHSQIEDLLTALSDLQRQHALTTDQLQREREERSDDGKAVQTLLQALRDKCTKAAVQPSKPPVTFGVQLRATETDVDVPLDNSAASSSSAMELSISQKDLLSLFEPIEARFASGADNRRSSVPQTKSQLRDELGRAKEQLANEMSKGQDRNQQLHEMEHEVVIMKDQLRDSHAHARVLHQEKQRLERQIHDLKTRVASEAASAAVAAAAGAAQLTHVGAADIAGSHATPGSSYGAAASNMSNSAMGIADAASEWFGRATGVAVGGGAAGKGGAGGLRELKLGRSNSTPTQGSAGGTNQASGTISLSTLNGSGNSNGKRSSSLVVRGPGRRESVFGGAPAYTHDADSAMEQQQEALVLELVQAKTAEAVARQEAEEAKQKLESLRKALGLSANDMSSMLHNASSSGGTAAAAVAAAAASTAASAAMGMLGRFTTSTSDGGANGAGAKGAAAPASLSSVPAAATTTQSSGYGFFGWRRS